MKTIDADLWIVKFTCVIVSILLLILTPLIISKAPSFPSFSTLLRTSVKITAGDYRDVYNTCNGTKFKEVIEICNDVRKKRGDLTREQWTRIITTSTRMMKEARFQESKDIFYRGKK